MADRALSISAPLANRVKNLGQKLKPCIEIKLSDEQQESSAPVYTSLDEINGEVLINASSDTEFEDVYITFEGAMKTYVEKVATTSPTNGRTEAFHGFLRLVQPMAPESFPEPRVLEAGKTYRFPFTFVVPERLLPQSCKHLKSDTFPDGGHLALPPSLGDPLVASVGKSSMDDMAPDMGSIAYAVKCRITSGRGPTGKIRILTENSKQLRIIPAVQEEPPLSVEGGLRDDYKLRKEKSIRKGLFKSKLGRLVMESAQPASLRLPPVRTVSEVAVTTMATVNVRFDPADEDFQPPRLSNLQAKLKVATFFASVPMHDLPTKSSDFHYSSVKGIFVDTLNLSSRCLANQGWEKHGPSSAPSSPNRRNSAWSMISSSNLTSPSSAYNGKSFYTARVVVPVSLPKGNKAFVPTFHSCLISRIYALDLYLSVITPSTSVSDPSLHLKLPIQISSEGTRNARPPLSANEANVVTSQAVDQFFDPRNIAPPNPEFTERAQLSAPPSPIPGRSPEARGSPATGRPTREYFVRLAGAQQRFQSLSFESENEEADEAAMAPPPEYSSAFRGRGGIQSSVPDQSGLPRVSFR